MRVSRFFAALVLGAALAGCGGGSEPPAASSPMSSPASSPAPAPPAEPARADAPDTRPAGRVVPLPSVPEGIVVGESGVAAVAVRNPAAITLVDAATGAVRQTIPTDGAARHLSLAGPDGPVLAPLETTDRLVLLNLRDGSQISVTGVGRQPHDAVRTADGTLVVTNERGGGVVFVRDGAVLGSLPAGPPQPGGVAAVGKYAAVADVQGDGVWVYDGPGRRQVAQAPVGTKLTHAVALAGDLAAFADTDGDAVLIERIDPQVTEVSRIDSPGKPYGLAFDPQRRLLFVTLTASNQLQVVDLADAARPRVLGLVPTVQQPNSVAVVPDSGSVLVTGSNPRGSLQIIAADLLPKA